MTNTPERITARPIPVSIGLLSRQSIIGAIVVLGVALLYILLLPFVNGLVPGDNDFNVGEPYVVGGTMQITPAPGWKLDPSSNELFTTFTKSGAAMILTGALPEDRTVDEMVQTSIDGLKADTTNTWIVGDPQTFVTDAGDHGVSLTAHATNDAQVSYYILNDTMSVTILATSPEGVWATVSPELDEMARSVRFLEVTQP